MLTHEQTTSILLKNQLALTASIACVSRSYHLAEDIFQEVCIGAIGHQKGFESNEHLLRWARVTGRHRAIDVLRTRDGKYQGLTDEVLDRLASAIHETADAMQSLKHEALRECMSRLTPNNREILRLRYFEGRTSSAIAAILGRKIATVYQAISRIHQSLGDCIEQRLSQQRSPQDSVLKQEGS